MHITSNQMSIIFESKAYDTGLACLHRGLLGEWTQAAVSSMNVWYARHKEKNLWADCGMQLKSEKPVGERRKPD